MTHDEPTRRGFLRGIGAACAATLVTGCDALSRTGWFSNLLATADPWNRTLHRVLTSRTSMAQEYSEADVAPHFRSNGTASPDDDDYRRLAGNGFLDWRLRVSGLVAQPASFTLAELRALPSRTQITRHDCVEGWSAIGKWTGVPLHELIARVRPDPAARFVVFYCADPMDRAGTRYYESIDMEDALHPQTILAYALNGASLPIQNGAPIRVRVERQLGYKMAKYIMAMELVESFDHIGRGKGGYWEDRGYAWYAGI